MPAFDKAVNHTYEGFRKLASDPALSQHERVGFYDHYREGKHQRIVDDLLAKLRNLRQRGANVVDIGCGGGVLATAMIEHCGTAGQQLTLVDSPEMLGHLPAAPWVTRISGRFPSDTLTFVRDNQERFDVVVAYSVIQYVFAESSIFEFLDSCLSLLAPAGELIMGDIPNISRRNRSSRASRAEGVPPRIYPLTGQMDDSVVLALLSRARALDFDAYVVPQDPDLPLAGTREDILIRRP